MGTVFSLVVGFVLVVGLQLVSAGGVIEVATPVAGVIAAGAAFAAAIIASLVSAEPHRAAMEATRDMRIPGGETVYDREMRQLRFSQRSRD